ncbi:translation initiation factor IF-5A [Candidatus Woesearchaeota archaeon]|jgi:translation initiation factor 5A|nr:translation initiation factor IF-5A [Candidatus Woesearchaeota archaeon]MBT4114420.1 translation initiation factor IF-5A [Candidatus Woesearchaeota archaeon]MBT4248283.1 translation initiation factor IF-5A [Candidatus Woesearchaeota archaeon]
MSPDMIKEIIGKLKEGRYIVIDGSACIIKKMQKSAPGKHGHAKYRVDAEDLLTGNKKVIMMTGHAHVDVPIIDKQSAQVLSISGKTAQIMDMETYETFDLAIPAELEGKVIAGANIIYWNILGKKIMKSVK